MNHELAVTTIGAVAALLSCSMALPQILHIVKTGSCTGVAPGTWAVIIANGILWLLYALLTGAYMAGVPSLVNIPLASYVLYRVHTDRGHRSSAAATAP